MLLHRKAHEHPPHLVVRELGRMREMTRRPPVSYTHLDVYKRQVISTPKGKSVFIVEEGKAKSVAVQTGISDGRWIEITSGLQGHEEVVAVGKRRLLDGMPVQGSPFNLPDAKLSQQKFERRVPGGTPPPPTSAPNGTSQKQGERP